MPTSSHAPARPARRATPAGYCGFTLAFVQLLLGSLVSGLLTVLGIVLCVLPGIYLGVSWAFTLPLIIDKKLDFWPAMELSRKMVGKHWWGVFGLMILCALVGLAGVCACVVGILVTSAIAEAAMMWAYEDIFGARPSSPA